MGMSRIEFSNIAALPVTSQNVVSLPTPPRTPSIQGAGTDLQNDKIPLSQGLPGEADLRAELEKEIMQQVLSDRKEILEKLKPPVTSTRLQVDKENQRIVIQILDEKNQVIRQIPPEEWLKFLSRWQKIQGLFFNEQA